jgi:hypothetical protein
MSKSFRITTAILAGLGVWLCTAVALGNGRWQAYLAASFFLAILFSVVAPGKVSRSCGNYIAILVLLLCGYFIYDSYRAGWPDFLNTLRFCAAYGTPAFAYLVFRTSPLGSDDTNKNAEQAAPSNGG